MAIAQLVLGRAPRWMPTVLRLSRANCPPLGFHSSGIQVGLDDHLSNLLIRPPAHSDADDMTLGVPRGRGQLRLVLEFLEGLGRRLLGQRRDHCSWSFFPSAGTASEQKPTHTIRADYCCGVQTHSPFFSSQYGSALIPSTSCCGVGSFGLCTLLRLVDVSSFGLRTLKGTQPQHFLHRSAFGRGCNAGYFT